MVTRSVIGPTPDQERVLRNLGHDPSDFWKKFREEITAFLIGELARVKRLRQCRTPTGQHWAKTRLEICGQMGLQVGIQVLRKYRTRREPAKWILDTIVRIDEGGFVWCKGAKGKEIRIHPRNLKLPYPNT